MVRDRHGCMAIRIAGVGLMAVGLIDAQPDARLTFEVASIKLTPPQNTGTMINFPHGGLTTKGTTLKKLVAFAYDVREFQIVGGPGWIGSERYDVIATSGDAEPDPKLARGQQRLQTLLADRFGVKVRRDTKEMGIYALAVGKDGHKLQEQPVGPGGQMISQPNMFKGIKATVPMLAQALSRALERVVTDQTGLTGKYNFTLEWTPDQGKVEGSDTSQPSSLFTAIQEQLGLKLQAQKGQVPVIVIEHAEKASEN
jgi:uncharacterized protein (TIGR03435 family)